MEANRFYNRLNEMLSNEQKEQIGDLMRFEPCDDNPQQEYIKSLAEYQRKYEEEHK